MEREYGPSQGAEVMRGLVEAARQVRREELINKSTGDCTLDWIYRNLSPESITLANYISINWLGEKTFEDLEGEELAELPEELYPEPVSILIQ